MKLNKAFKFRLYPNKKQCALIDKTFGCVRFIYNKMLSDKIDYYSKYEKSLNVNPSSYKKEFVWLKEVDSLALASVWTNLNTAFNNFFKQKNVGFPKFKSKKRNKLTYTTYNLNNSIRFNENNKKLKLPKLGFIKIVKHREIPNDYKIKSCTLSKTPTDKYYIAILTEYHKDIIKKEIKTKIGLDFKMDGLFYSSENTTAKYFKYYRKSLAKLKKESRKLSKKKKGGKNRNKQRIKVATLHEKIANQRKDFLHKISTKLTNKYDAIIIEDLNMKNMSQCLKFGKSVMDNGWGMFTSYLDYKLKLQGKQLIKIDKWFPSSKKCSECGNVKKELRLSDREYICNKCGIVIDRDYNASLNILRAGTALLA